MATQHDLTEVLAFLDEGHEYTGVKSARHPEGKTYRVPPPSAKTGLWLTAIAELGLSAATGEELSAEDRAALSLNNDEERSFHQRVLGPAYTEMVEDGVSWAALQAISRHAFLTFSTSQDMADADLMTTLGKARSREVSTTRPTPPRTARKTAGSASPKASGGTRARTRSTASTRSSTSPSGPEQDPPEVAANG